MVPCKSTAKEVSFEWSRHRISSTNSRDRTTLHVNITDFGSARGNALKELNVKWALTLLSHLYFLFSCTCWLCASNLSKWTPLQ